MLEMIIDHVKTSVNRGSSFSSHHFHSLREALPRIPVFILFSAFSIICIILFLVEDNFNQQIFPKLSSLGRAAISLPRSSQPRYLMNPFGLSFPISQIITEFLPTLKWYNYIFLNSQHFFSFKASKVIRSSY